MNAIGLAAVMVLVGQGAVQRSQLPALSEPTAVDLRVESYQWHPHGEGALYARKEDSGTGIGIYRLGDLQGDVLLHLRPDETYEMQWFESAAAAIVIAYRKVDGKTEIGIHVIDARTKKAKKLFGQVFEGDADVDVDPSPSLIHAIFRLKTGERRQHLVMTQGGGALVYSRDLDRAVESGFSGPVWANTGSAVYQKGGTEQPVEIALKEGTNQVNGTITFQVVLDASEIKLSGSRFWVASRPAPPTGTPVLEVIPANGAVREIKFPGPWEWTRPEFAPLDVQLNPQRLEFRGEAGHSQSLWLVPGDVKGAKGIFVSAQADKPSIAPENRALGYLTDGVLFVRKMSRR